jgi:hypothetical protein
VVALLVRSGPWQLRAKTSMSRFGRFGDGNLPIHLAARSSRSAEGVALLVRSGPWQLAAEDPDGHTPLAVAGMWGRPEALSALLRPTAAEGGEEGEERGEEQQHVWPYLYIR